MNNPEARELIFTDHPQANCMVSATGGKFAEERSLSRAGGTDRVPKIIFPSEAPLQSSSFCSAKTQIEKKSFPFN